MNTPKIQATTRPSGNMRNVKKRQIVVRLLQEGLTQVEVGQRLGLTRQRIRQLAEDDWYSIIAPPDGYMTLDQAAKQMGYAAASVFYLASRGQLKAIKRRRQWFVQLPSIWKSCVICGAQVAKHRQKYCSDKCSVEGGRKSLANCSWRILYKRIGKRPPPSIDYVRAPAKS